MRGEAAHSSRPELGCSAIVAAARAVLALQDEHDRLQTEPPITEVGVGSINVGLISGGTAGNIVPDLCTFTVGRRVCPGEDPEAVAAALRTLIEGRWRPCTATFTPIGTGVPSAGFYQPPDAPVVQALADATGSAPAVAPYGTQRAALRRVRQGAGGVRTRQHRRRPQGPGVRGDQRARTLRRRVRDLAAPGLNGYARGRERSVTIASTWRST